MNMNGTLRGKVFPDHWSLRLGQISFYSFVVVLLSGVFLMFWYDASSDPVVYDGPYPLLRGVAISRALDSTLELSFEVRGGLLMRQAHHWGSLVMVAAIMLQLLRLFFTAAFRRPRTRQWLVVFGLFVVMLAACLTGTSLPGDMPSGTSLAVLDGVLRATPLIGTALSALVFGGEFPGGVIERFYPLHVVVLPALLGVLFALLVRRVRRPAAAVATSVGLFCCVAGVVMLLAGTATINPVWLYGPADPANASAGVGPAWYLAFLDGALRLAPGWEVVVWGRTLTLAVLLPVAVCTLFLVLVAGYPFIERWVTGDRRAHHLPERPRDNPTRTGIGVAGITFYGVLWAAAGADTIATVFQVSVNALLQLFQLLLIVGPPAGLVITRRYCMALRARDEQIALDGTETGQIVRLPDGGYVERHRPVDAARRRQLTGYVPAPSMLPPRTTWRVSPVQRLRARLSRSFDEGRVTPPPPTGRGTGRAA